MQTLPQTSTKRNEVPSQQKRAAAISAYNRQVRLIEAKQARIEAMLAKTAAESPEHAGDILWAV